MISPLTDRKPQFDVENFLESSFRPVAPDPHFVKRLRTRLITPPVIVVEPRTNYAAALVVLGLAILGGGMAVWLIHRLTARG